MSASVYATYTFEPPHLCSFFFFFFSSRRRHTRFDCDWSSDVCSSDLHLKKESQPACSNMRFNRLGELLPGRVSGSRLRSEERRVGKGVDLGGRRIIKKKKERIESRLYRVNITQQNRRQAKL